MLYILSCLFSKNCIIRACVFGAQAYQQGEAAMSWWERSVSWMQGIGPTLVILFLVALGVMFGYSVQSQKTSAARSDFQRVTLELRQADQRSLQADLALENWEKTVKRVTSELAAKQVALALAKLDLAKFERELAQVVGELAIHKRAWALLHFGYAGFTAGKILGAGLTSEDPDDVFLKAGIPPRSFLIQDENGLIFVIHASPADSSLPEVPHQDEGSLRFAIPSSFAHSHTEISVYGWEKEGGRRVVKKLWPLQEE